MIVFSKQWPTNLRHALKYSFSVNNICNSIQIKRVLFAYVTFYQTYALQYFDANALILILHVDVHLIANHTNRIKRNLLLNTISAIAIGCRPPPATRTNTSCRTVPVPSRRPKKSCCSRNRAGVRRKYATAMCRRCNRRRRLQAIWPMSATRLAKIWLISVILVVAPEEVPVQTER